MPQEGRAHVCPVPDPSALPHTYRQTFPNPQGVNKCGSFQVSDSALPGLSYSRIRYFPERLLGRTFVLHIPYPVLFQQVCRWLLQKFLSAPCELMLHVTAWTWECSPWWYVARWGPAHSPSLSHAAAVQYLLGSRHIRKANSSYNICILLQSMRCFHE